jgi:hypothetical protein
MDVLAKTIDQIQNNEITSLHINNDVNNEQIFEAMCLNTSIITLICYSDHNRCYELLGKLLESNTTINFIYISNDSITNEQWKYIIHGLSKNKTVTFMSISANNIDDRDCVYLAQLLEVNHTLIDLLLFTPNMHLSGYEKLVCVLKHNPSLAYITYRKNGVINVDRKIRKYCERNKHNREVKCKKLTEF